MNILVQITTDTYMDGVKRFLGSLGWTYVTYRYPPEVRTFVLRMLTLSTLDPWDWERCIMSLASQPGSALAELLAYVRLGSTDESVLPRAVGLIRTYAQQQGKRLGEPPAAPTYLLEYGYNHQAYQADLEQVYGLPLEPRYLEPWPDFQESRPEPPLMLQPNLLRRAAAVMGATAGAIDQLMTMGADNGQRN